MQRIRFVLMIAMLAVAACSADSAQSTTTDIAESSTSETTTTTIQVATTLKSTITTADESASSNPIVLAAGRTVFLEPDSAYAVSGLLVPLGFRVHEEGWRWFGVGADWAYLGWFADGRLGAALAVLGYRSTQSPGDVVEAIVSIDGVEPLQPPRAVTLGGWQGLTVDVEGASRRAQTNDKVCTGDARIGRFQIDEPGHPLVAGAEPFYYGIAACKTSRVWVVGADGESITLVGGATHPAEFDELMPVVERLLDSMSFEAP